MIVRTFVCEENKEYGGTGWRPKWQEHFDPYTSMAIPHDCLEHRYPGDGGAEEEFMAIGAAWVIRGDTGWFGRNGSTIPSHINLASDLPEIFRRIASGDQTLKDPGITRALDDNDEPAIQSIVEAGWVDIQSEADDYDNGLSDLLSNENKRRLTGWLRRGVRWARGRYRDADLYSLAYHVFSSVSDEADEKLRIAGIGDLLRVRIDPVRSLFDVRLIERWK